MQSRIFVPHLTCWDGEEECVFRIWSVHVQGLPSSLITDVTLEKLLNFLIHKYMDISIHLTRLL